MAPQFSNGRKVATFTVSLPADTRDEDIRNYGPDAVVRAARDQGVDATDVTVTGIETAGRVVTLTEAEYNALREGRQV